MATFGSIAAWMIHLVAEASLAARRESHPSVVWAMQALTVLLVALVVAGMRVSWSFARAGDIESSGSPAGRTTFLGLVGLVIGALDLLLIVYEGVLIAVLRRSL